MKMFKKFVVLLVMVTVVFSISAPVFAASKPYKDVTKNVTVNSVEYKSIVYLKKHHAYDGIVKGKYFYPYKVITRKQFLKMLINLYGKKSVPITATDKKKYNKPISNTWACKKLNAVSKKRGGVSHDLPLIHVGCISRAFASDLIQGYCIYGGKACKPIK